MWTLRSLSVLVFTLSACGADGGAGPQVEAASDFLGALAVAGCDVLAECPMARSSQVAIQSMAIASPEGCRDSIVSLRKSRIDYAALVAEGALSFDAAAGERCLAEFRRHCEEYSFEDLAPCRDVFTGAVPLGESCRTDFECAGDAYCTNWIDPVCPGTCEARLALGEHCSSDGMCSTGAGPAACSVGACAPLSFAVAEPGGACGEIGDLERISVVTCPDGYFCDHPGTIDAPRTCVPRVARGAACDPSEDLCAEQGDGCLSDGGGGEVCRPILALGPGAACSAPLTTADAVCNALDRLACVADGCVLAGDGREGSLCGDAVLVGCVAGFGCVDGTCRAFLEDGAACTDDAQCAGYCDGVCVAACEG